MKNFKDSGQGITKESFDLVNEKINEIGNLITIRILWDGKGECDTIFFGTEGRIKCTGFAVGYLGQGPKVLVDILQKVTNIPFVNLSMTVYYSNWNKSGEIEIQVENGYVIIK